MRFPFAILLALISVADARTGVGNVRKGSGLSEVEESTAKDKAGFGTKRKMGKSTNSEQEAETCSTKSCPTYDFRDWTNREGLGESPGIPNLEYLGLGYNIFEGNPRGSDISESDPGFRSGVVKLIQQQTNLTIDQEYMVPLGVDLKYATACKFASKSTELSTEAQYRSEISKEASASVETSFGIDFGIASISAEFSFSQSSKLREFTETTRNTESVTYEARAMCSEFQASFKPYSQPVLEEEFKLALDTLTYPWTNSSTQRTEYSKFFSSFGTHYVRDVTLGAKHIFSSTMAAEDVSDLRKEEIDVSTSLSFSVQASFGGGGEGNEEYGKLPRSEAETVTKGVKSKTYTYVFEEAGGAEIGTESSLSTSESAATSTLNKVKSKVVTVSETNIGGNPPQDGNWKTWATTVRDRPMPIAYELSGLWNFIEEETKIEAFFHAFVELYGIDLREKKDENIVNSLRFGVARGDGKAISSYNRDPSSNYRTKIERTLQPKQPDPDTDVTGNIVKLSLDNLDHEDECGVDGNKEWSGWTPPPKKGYYGCGMAVRYIDGEGISQISVWYCSKDDWSKREVRGSGPNLPHQKFCRENQFITRIKVRADNTYDGTPTGNEGIESLWFTCVDENGVEDQDRKVFVGTNGGEETSDGRAGYFLSNHRVKACAGLGIFGLELEFKEEEVLGGPSDNFYEYSVIWEGQEKRTVSAIFATAVRGKVGPNTEEDENELGFVFHSRREGDNVFNIESYYPFGLMTDPYRPKLVVQDFKDTLYKNELHSFSFLSGNNLPAESSYVAGVVHPDAYPLNDVFGASADIGYRITQASNQEYRITFPDGSVKNPTFIVFPLWFPTDENLYPASVGDIVVATRSCGYDECSVVLGADPIGVAKDFLGFSFIALDGNLNTDVVGGIAHGVVTISDRTIDESLSRFNGFNATIVAPNSPEPITVKSGKNNGEDLIFDKDKVMGGGGGILISFSDSFRGMPAVIVSPIIGGKTLAKSGETDKLSLPYAIVEHITEETAFVKVNWVNTMANEPSIDIISFHVVIVGPQRDPYLYGEK